MPPGEARPAVFLDRDGLLNELVFYPDTGEWESPRGPGDFALLPGVAATLSALRGAGWPLFLVSNQPSFAKGKTSLEALGAVHARLLAELGEGAFAGVYYCHHHPQGRVPGYSGPCPCRKPSPRFLLEAAREHGLDLARSWMVGDQDRDVLCGRNAGCRTILIPNAHSSHKRGAETPDVVCTEIAGILPVIGFPPPFPNRSVERS